MKLEPFPSGLANARLLLCISMGEIREPMTHWTLGTIAFWLVPIPKARLTSVDNALLLLLCWMLVLHGGLEPKSVWATLSQI